MRHPTTPRRLLFGLISALIGFQPAFATEYRIQVPLAGVAASAAAGPGAIAVSPSSVTFPSTQVGATADAIPVTVTNTGNAAIGSIAVALTDTSGSFAKTSNCPETLSAHASCTVSVSFVPALSGAQSASLSVSSNASNGLQLVSVAGEAVQPPLLSVRASSTGAMTQTMTIPAPQAAYQLKGTRGTTVTFSIANSGGGMLSGIATFTSGRGFISALGSTCGGGDAGSNQSFFTLAGGQTCSYYYSISGSAAGTATLFTVKFSANGLSSAYDIRP